MIEEKEIQTIKQAVEKFFKMTTIVPLSVDVFLNNLESETQEKIDIINIKVKLSEPQILIGEKGQTLFEIQRILKIILNKKLKKNFYLNLDINEYKSKKSEYLISIAKDLADEVAITKKDKILIPMSAYERRIIHSELSKRQDIKTQSDGTGTERHIIIKPK